MTRRISADAPGSEDQQWGQHQHVLEQQLAEARAALKQCQQCMAEQQMTALAEQAAETEERAATVARTRNRMSELVENLQRTHQDHANRVCQQDVTDFTGDMLRQLAQLQSSLPSYSAALFHDVTEGMVEQWTNDIEELETALSGPYLEPPVSVSAEDAQMVCKRLNEMWQQLEDPPDAGVPPMQMLLLTKKLLCVDQLRPEVDNGSPYQCFELRALLMRLSAHPRVWSYTLRFPCSVFDSVRDRMTTRAAKFFYKASLAAQPGVQQQSRLLVEQCKVLERADRLDEATLGSSERGSVHRHPPMSKTSRPGMRYQQRRWCAAQPHWGSN
jgi:hypothetical protein